MLKLMPVMVILNFILFILCLIAGKNFITVAYILTALSPVLAVYCQSQVKRSIELEQAGWYLLSVFFLILLGLQLLILVIYWAVMYRLNG